MSGLERLSRSSAAAFELLPHPVWIVSLATLRIMAANGAASHRLGSGDFDRNDLTIADFGPFAEESGIRQRLHSLQGELAESGQWTIGAARQTRAPSAAVGDWCVQDPQWPPS
ncbi:hypothetical protein GCM10007989_38840 [Devosia pacifica]|uniref:Uncharacterized protein n=1 Tax=Devosia pacifica TaxID=1335967 RepID=A0A918SGD2_9HYPH|nr:hypothetical protein [Devosia pacifica]GHA39340.1 hypothetical protein GCM10007989_38840 [Devosia pacifica]